jgi:hypothetical protein
MRHVWKKQLSALLLALVMVVSLVPAASAASESDIKYSVTPGGEVAFREDDFNNVYQNSASGTIKWVEFTYAPSTLTSAGAIYYDRGYSSQRAFSRTTLGAYKFYYGDYNTYGDYKLNALSFVADSGFTGSVTLRFRAYYSDARYEDGTLTLAVSSNTIEYSVTPGNEVGFDENDFNDIYRNFYTGNIKWVEFTSVPSTLASAGAIYFDYGYSTQKAFTRSNLGNYGFYYGSNRDSGAYALDDLSFVANSGFTGSVTLSFRAYYSASVYVDGTLTLTVKGGKGNIAYTVAPGKTVAFDEDDFNDYYRESYSGNIKWVVFTSVPPTLTTNGTVYCNYGYSSQKSFSRSEMNYYGFYYGDNTGSGSYPLGQLSFAADSGFTGTLTLEFRAYNSSSRYVDGTLTITSAQSSSSTKGDISYEVEAGKSVAFDEKDFNAVYKNSYAGNLLYVRFTGSSGLTTTAGSVYSNYSYNASKRFTASTLEEGYFYYDPDDIPDDDSNCYALEDLSFVANSKFETTVVLSFRAYRSSNRYVDGTLVITPKTTDTTTTPSTTTTTTATSNYVGSVRYSTTGTNVQISANDITRFFNKSCPGHTMQYVLLTGIPTTGSVYYNYYGASQYGTSARTQVTAANAAGMVFYASPASNAQYALTELTYVPSGSNYCVSIPFTAYGDNNTSVTGAILISVSTAAVAEVYGVTPKNTTVSFPASSLYSAVQTATGSGLSSIQLLRLPDAAVGTVYIGTGNTAANTTTAYAYTGTDNTISQLRFVPASNYTGNVEIPYVALNSSGAAIASGVFAMGVVNARKTFTDVAATSWCYKYVTELSDASVIAGYSDGSFKPDNKVTYGAALKLIMLAAGYPEQAPTDKNVFSGYLAKARSEGIVTRVNVDLTKPITRLQMAQLAAGALKLDTSSLSTVQPFTDTTNDSVRALNAAGIVEGYFSNGTSTFKPGNTLTRGQLSAIVWRMRNYSK